MPTIRRFFSIVAVAGLMIVAASLALTRLSPSPAAPVVPPALAQVHTEAPAPTKTTFIFPTLAAGPVPTSTAALPSGTPVPSMTPSATPVPATLTPTSAPSLTPAPPAATSSTAESPVLSAEGLVTPLPAISDTETTVIYTVMINDVYGRRQPVLDSSLYQPLGRGQSYTVTAQSPDNIWLSLEMPRGKQPVWVPAAFGRISGSRQAVPLAGPTEAPLSAPVTATQEITPPVTLYPYLSGISPRTRDIYRYGLLLGNRSRAFMKIGDCQTIYPFFLSAFDNPKSYHLGDANAYLQATIQQFSGSFSRRSAAAQTGFGTGTVLDPQWADPNVCQTGESPLVCEYRTMRPSLAFVSLGTNDIWEPDGRHEKNLRQIIEYLIHQGVVPILSTKADNVEGDDSFNRLVVRLAEEYQLPLWDFWQVTRSLPQFGMVDNYHLSWGPVVFDDPKNMLLGWPWRNLSALQALDAVWRAVR